MIAAQKSEAPLAGGAIAEENTEQATILSYCEASRKREASLIAQAALAGVSVYATQDERGRPEWLATKWALTRAFASHDEIEAWLACVTGRTA